MHACVCARVCTHTKCMYLYLHACVCSQPDLWRQCRHSLSLRINQELQKLYVLDKAAEQLHPATRSSQHCLSVALTCFHQVLEAEEEAASQETCCCSCLGHTQAGSFIVKKMKQLWSSLLQHLLVPWTWQCVVATSKGWIHPCENEMARQDDHTSAGGGG